MRRFITALLVVVLLFTVAIPKREAKADGLTMAMVSGGIAAIANASGLDFSFTGYDGTSVSQWIENRVNSFLAGRSLTEVFGSELIRITAGKLVIPAAAVAGITSFLSDFIQTSSLSENASESTVVAAGMINGQILYQTGLNIATVPKTPFNSTLRPSWAITEEFTNGAGNRSYAVTCYGLDGNVIVNDSFSGTWNYTPVGYFIEKLSDSSIRIKAVMQTGSGNNPTYDFKSRVISISEQMPGQVTARIPGAYVPPQGLNDLQQWEGEITDAPDTNIGDMLDDIFEQQAEGTLDVTGEVVDTPAETPTTPIPTVVPDTNIGQMIGSIDSMVTEISETLEGVGEQVGTISETLEGVGTGVGAISEALTVPSTAEAQSLKLPDLRTLFPFCIPFDVYNIITAFNVEPQAPHVQIPFNIPAVGLQYTFDLDFSEYNGVASILRTVEFVAFAVGLAILTSKVIRW